MLFADDEFNLPDERHPLEVLQALVDAELASHVAWRAYLNPTPFSDRFAELAAQTNGFVSVTVDSAADAVIDRAGKPFRRRHLEALLERVRAHGVRTELGLIFGLPGETGETVAETIDFVRGLPDELEVAYAVGARAYPNTPLARIAAEEPQHLHGAPRAALANPTIYCAVGDPRVLARELEVAFADRPNVERMGVGYRRSTHALSHAYRAVLAGDRRRWDEALDRTSLEPGAAAARTLVACLRIALWHERFDLAGSAVGRLRHADLPADVSSAGLLRARVVFGGDAGSDVEADVDDVAVRDDVVAALDAHHAALQRLGVRLRQPACRPSDHLGADEAAGDVGVDLAGGLDRASSRGAAARRGPPSGRP